LTNIPPVLPLLLFAALLLAVFGRSSPRFHRRITILCVLLFLWSWPPFAALLNATLEAWYPVRPYPAAEAQAVVVLGGAVYAHTPSQPEDLPGIGTLLRTSYAGWLYTHWRPLPILVSGGPLDALHVSVSGVMARVLEERGIPPSMIWRENSSRSTYENAVYSAALLRARGIRTVALVTEARHMLRAEACFRRQGLDVVPAPCCYRALPYRFRWTDLLPKARAMTENEDALHEWIGLLWYFAARRI